MRAGRHASRSGPADVADGKRRRADSPRRGRGGDPHGSRPSQSGGRRGARGGRRHRGDERARVHRHPGSLRRRGDARDAEARDPARPGGLSAGRADGRAERHRPARGPDRDAVRAAPLDRRRGERRGGARGSGPASLHGRGAARCARCSVPGRRDHRDRRGCVHEQIHRADDRRARRPTPPARLACAWQPRPQGARAFIRRRLGPGVGGRSRRSRSAGVHAGTRRTRRRAACRHRIHRRRSRRHLRSAAVPTLGRLLAASPAPLDREPGGEQGAGPDLACGRRSRRVQLWTRRATFGRSCGRPTLGGACCG